MVFHVSHSFERNYGGQGWRSGESLHLPPMWPGFDCRTYRHMWVEFVVGSRSCSERFYNPLGFRSQASAFVSCLFLFTVMFLETWK